MPTRKQRVAVVTGGGSGIGVAVAHALAGDGWTVVLAGRRREALEAVVAGGSGLIGALDAIPTDVTDEASVRSLFETTVQRYGRVDLLFNNAGIGAPSVDIDALDLESWNKVLAVNLTVPFSARGRRSGPCASKSRGAVASSTTIDIRTRSTATFDCLYRNQTRHHRPYQIDRARRAGLRYRLWTDRYRQRGDRHGQRRGVGSCPS